MRKITPSVQCWGVVQALIMAASMRQAAQPLVRGDSECWILWALKSAQLATVTANR